MAYRIISIQCQINFDYLGYWNYESRNDEVNTTRSLLEQKLFVSYNTAQLIFNEIFNEVHQRDSLSAINLLLDQLCHYLTLVGVLEEYF